MEGISPRNWITQCASQAHEGQWEQAFTKTQGAPVSAHGGRVLTYNRNMAQLPRRKSSTAVPPIIAASSVLAGAGLVLAWIAYSRTRIEHNLPLTAALDADLRVFESPSAGTLGYYVGGIAQRGAHPLLLIHGINSAASSFQMRPLFNRFAQSRRVYALDLPGFGFSNRGDRPYSAALMRDKALKDCRTFRKEVRASLGLPQR